MIHITELGGEYYRFDEVRQELRGDRSGVRYAIGSRVRVQVSRVDLDGRKIDFRLVRDGEPGALLARAKKDKLGEAVADRPKRTSEVLEEVLEADRQVKSRTKASQGKARATTNEAKAHPVRAAKSAARGATKKSAKATTKAASKSGGKTRSKR